MSSDDNFGDALVHLFDESLARGTPQNLVVKPNLVGVSSPNPTPITVSALESESTENLLSKLPKSEGKDVLSGHSNIPVTEKKSDEFFLLSQLDGSFFSAKIREEIGVK